MDKETKIVVGIAAAVWIVATWAVYSVGAPFVAAFCIGNIGVACTFLVAAIVNINRAARLRRQAAEMMKSITR